MPNITMTVPAELHAKMKQHPEFKWSEIARQAIEERISDARLLDDLRAIRKAEKNLRDGKTLSHAEVKKRLGL